MRFKRDDLVQLCLPDELGFRVAQGGPMRVTSHRGQNVMTENGGYWQEHLTHHPKHWDQPHIIRAQIAEHRKAIKKLQKKLRTR